MDEREAFLRAIAAAPDDDVPRLVFADWLQEHGEEGWANLIRLECEMARLPVYDRRYQESLYHGRTRDVIEVKRPLNVRLPDGLSWREFETRRGFLAVVRVSQVDAFIAHADWLFSTNPVEGVEVRIQSRHTDQGIPPEDFVRLVESPAFARVRELHAHLGDLGPEPIRRLIDSPYNGSLRVAQFPFGGITGDGVTELIGSELAARLHALDLRHNAYVSAPLTGLVEGLNRLRGPCVMKSLNLTYAHPGPDEIRAIAASPLGETLEDLTLAENRLGPEGVSALAGAGSFRRLRSLDLDKANPQAPGIDALAGSSILGGLRLLSLRYNRLGPVAVRAVAGSANFRELSVLRLTHNPIKDAGARAIARSPHLINLVTLDLRDCQIGNPGAKALMELPNLAGIVRLDLSENPISDGVLKALADRFGERLSAWRPRPR